MRAIFLRAMVVSVSKRGGCLAYLCRGRNVADRLPRMTTIASFFATARRLGDRLAWKYGDREHSWTEAAQLVRRAARAYVGLGVKPGEKVSIVGPNRPEWLIADLGAIAAGAVPAPIYPTLTA